MAAGRKETREADRMKPGLRMPARGKAPLLWAVLGALLLVQALVITGVFAPVLRAQALSLDDSEYFADNPLVRNPGWASIGTFFGEVLRPSTVEGYYHPLTMVSLMLDHAAAGDTRDLSDFHRTALGLHVANSLLISLLCYMLFGHPVIACASGLVFGLHPLCVEPVAWITERKTLLAAFFSLICMVAYVQFVRGGRRRFLVLGFFSYSLALLSKPTAIPLPFILLALDYWPLRRLSWRSVVEKTPAWVLAVAFAIITYVSQARSGHVSVQAGGLVQAVTRCVYLLGFYVRKVLWPDTLCGFYQAPQPLSLSNPAILSDALLCIGILAISVALLRHTRAPAACGVVFGLALFPTLGVLRSGFADAADKYVYLPMTGVMILAAWAIVALAERVKARGRIFPWAAAVMLLAILVAEAGMVRRGLSIWQSTGSLFAHLLRFSPDNGRIRATYGVALAGEGRWPEAKEQFHRALESSPDDPIVIYNAAVFTHQQGDTTAAISLYEKAIGISPNDDLIMNNLATALAGAGRPEEARIAFERTLAMNPGLHEAHAHYAALLEQLGQPGPAVIHWRRAMEAPIPDPQALGRLAKLLATSADAAIQQPVEAIGLAERACIMTSRRDPKLLDILATTYACSGRFDEAIRAASEALKLYQRSGATAAAMRQERNIAGFQAGRGR